MRHFSVILAGLSVLSTSCDSPEQASPAPLSKDEVAAAEDVPILPVSIGDSWIYQVHLEIPAGVSSPGSAAVSTKYRRTRSYLGKIAAAAGLPETDCFEVTVPGSPTEREFVEIRNDRILMRGSLVMRPESSRPMWLEPPVLFVRAGMKSGMDLPDLKSSTGGLIRKTRVIAREDITVPAGTYPCIRLLTTGNDGDLELRRTVWFSPGHGIIREDKSRYRHEQLVFRETQELMVIKMKLAR